jgi:hypothetical protein
LVEWSKPWTDARPLDGLSVGALLEALGAGGNACDRRAAIIALLGGCNEAAANGSGGAFAAPNVTPPLTNGFHNCLRDPPVSAGEQPDNDRLPRKQC